MVGLTYFAMDCDVCGRPLRVKVEYLGKEIACPHCRARFRAKDSDLAPPTTSFGTGWTNRSGVSMEFDSLMPISALRRTEG